MMNHTWLQFPPRKNEVSSLRRSISIPQNIIHEKLSIFQIPAWNSIAKFFHFEVLWLRNPWTEWAQKVLGTTIFTPEHVCKISFRLLNIFENLGHEERIALDREEEEKKQKKSE